MYNNLDQAKNKESEGIYMIGYQRILVTTINRNNIKPLKT